MLEGDTTVKLYFANEVEVRDENGKLYSLKHNSSGYYVEAAGIASGELQIKYVFKVTGTDGKTYTIKHSVLGWAAAMINKPNNKPATVHLAQALYNYNRAALAYFG